MSQRCFTRSQAAFVFSVERLFAMGKPVYFWTFTFKRVYDETDYAWRWTSFVKAIEYAHCNRRGRGRMFGLRVVEPHESHGLHYHALLNFRLSVHIVRRVGVRFGIGRVDVIRCEDSGVGLYLAKYLAKSKRFGSRVRSWGVIGGFLACRCSDVEIDSPFHRCMRELVPDQQVDFRSAALVMGMSRLHGDLKHWPAGGMVQVRGSLAKAGYNAAGGKSYRLRRDSLYEPK